MLTNLPNEFIPPNTIRSFCLAILANHYRENKAFIADLEAIHGRCSSAVCSARKAMLNKGESLSHIFGVGLV